MTPITRVLLVEDDPGDHLLVLKLLDPDGDARQGVSLAHSSCLQAALDRLGKGDVDAVLLDLNLPDSEGVATVTRLREHDAETPLVVFTSAGDEETALLALKAGAQDYIVKGELTAPLMRRSIRYAIERCRMESEKRRLRALLLEAEKLESLRVFGAGAASGFERLTGEILDYADHAIGALSSGGPGTLQWHLSSIRHAASRASDLAAQLREYATLSPPEMAALDLSAFVVEASSFVDAIVSPEISVDYDLARSLPTARGDALRLRQLLTSFVVNAAEAIGGREGRIVVSTGRLNASVDLLLEAQGAVGLEPGRYLFLRVADDGCYIEPQVRSRLFDPFYSTRSASRGLGLSTALAVARQHGGAIHVSSSPREGTSFMLLLPLEEEHDESTSRPESRAD